MRLRWAFYYMMAIIQTNSMKKFILYRLELFGNNVNSQRIQEAAIFEVIQIDIAAHLASLLQLKQSLIVESSALQKKRTGHAEYVSGCNFSALFRLL